MTIKTEAAIKTVFFVGTMVLAALGMTYLLEYLDPNVKDVMYTVAAVCFAVWIYIIYSYQVSQAQYREKLAEMTKSSTANQ